MRGTHVSLLLVLVALAWTVSTGVDAASCSGTFDANSTATFNPVTTKTAVCSDTAEFSWCSVPCQDGWSGNFFTVEQGVNIRPPNVTAYCSRGKWVLFDTCSKGCTEAPKPPVGGTYDNCVLPAGEPFPCAAKCTADPSYTAKATCNGTTGIWFYAKNNTCGPREACSSGPGMALYSEGLDRESARNCTGTPDGGTCEVKCGGVGFFGTANAVCDDNTWRISRSCDRACPPTIDSSSAFFTFNPATTKPAVCNNTAPGDTCTVECKEGFTVVDPFSGDRQSKVSVRCNGGGGWDWVFCQKDCTEAPRDPLGGAYTGCKLPASSFSACRAVCNTTDYRASAVCGIEGTWSYITNNTCAPPQACTEYSPYTEGMDFMSTVNCSNTPHGGTCKFKCDAEMGYVGSPSATCNDGSWDVTRRCFEGGKECPQAPGFTSTTEPPICTGSFLGDTCTANCSQGLSGAAGLPAAAVCSEQGTWFVYKDDCTKRCASSPTAPGAVFYCNYTAVGETCYAGCDVASGWQLPAADKAPMATCLDTNTWSAVSNNCVKNTMCPETFDVNRLTTNAPTCTNRTSGSRCMAGCRDGYIGGVFGTCSRKGRWRFIAGSCNRACFAPNPPAPEGTTFSCRPTLVGRTCQGSCQSGWRQSSADLPPTVKCMANGRFSRITRDMCIRRKRTG